MAQESVQSNFDIADYVREQAVAARTASRVLAGASTGQKNEALAAIAGEIESSAAVIRECNEKDLQAGRKQGLNEALLDRLELTGERIDAMAAGLRQVAALPDPVGEVSELRNRPSGIQVGRMRVPLGVIGIIYESRPNVTADAAALCLKSGNAAILRGGSEAIHSNLAIAECIYRGLAAAGLTTDCVQVIETTDRGAVGALLRLQDHVDVIVPRGGRGLIERVASESLIPVIKHLDGNCHVYVDGDADPDKAVAVAVNAKCRRYGICGAMETLLVDLEIAATVLPRLDAEYREHGVELRGCTRTREILPSVAEATESDWFTEYLAPVLAVKVVDGIDQAIEHIQTYGSGHTDAIVTDNLSRSRKFLTEVDSSSVMVNASTQFADGFEYGLGAEIGISTNKLHVRGPVGLEGLTTQKYIVFGDGTVRE